MEQGKERAVWVAKTPARLQKSSVTDGASGLRRRQSGASLRESDSRCNDWTSTSKEPNLTREESKLTDKESALTLRELRVTVEASRLTLRESQVTVEGSRLTRRESSVTVEESNVRRAVLRTKACACCTQLAGLSATPRGRRVRHRRLRALPGRRRRSQPPAAGSFRRRRP